PLLLVRLRIVRVLAWERDLALERRHAVAEAAVDRLLRRPQGREWFAALVHVLELDAHHRAQRAAPPMRRVDADDAHAGRRDDRARDGHLERKDAGAPDDLRAVARRVHPLERHVSQEALEPLVRRLRAEVLRDREERVAELVEVSAPPDVEIHQAMRSSGAYSSIRRRSAPSSAKRTVTTPPGSIEITTPSPSVP